MFDLSQIEQTPFLSMWSRSEDFLRWGQGHCKDSFAWIHHCSWYHAKRWNVKWSCSQVERFVWVGLYSILIAISEHLQYRIMAKCRKILDILNKRTIVAVFRAIHYAKKIKTYHKKLKRIRADLEVRNDYHIGFRAFFNRPRQLSRE